MKPTAKISDELFMLECLALAEKGRGLVNPNPMVGCVIVKNNKVVARGYHKRFGLAHAEVDAIRSAKTSLKGATLYVNLEPCNYFGKTPPCTDLIISVGISRVVVGMHDPNPRVSGKGIQLLRKAGIEIRSNVLKYECHKLNESFSKYIATGMPFVTLKIAQTVDGKIADAAKNSKWISNSKSRKLVHLLRSSYDAILVGANTINHDNPQLTVREVKGNSPVRVILDGAFRVDPGSKIFSQKDGKTIIFVSSHSARTQSVKKSSLIRKGVEIIESRYVKGQISLEYILKVLGSKGISSVLVEGGAQIFSSFVQNRLADKLLIFISPKIFGKGLDAFGSLTGLNSKQYVALADIASWEIENDILIEAYLKNN